MKAATVLKAEKQRKDFFSQYHYGQMAQKEKPNVYKALDDKGNVMHEGTMDDIIKLYGVSVSGLTLMPVKL